jgi:AraC-like DNA-binding protein
MTTSESHAKDLLESILYSVGDTGGYQADVFRLIVAMAVESYPGGEGCAPRDAMAVLHGGLASWQLRKAKELMMEALNQPLSITHIARECGLSYSHFNRAFRRSVGLPPRQWMCSIRIERAKWLLINTEQTLSEVSLACGFGERCHFTRTFTRLVGMAPGAWRRAFGEDSELWKGVHSPTLSAP